MNDIYIYAGIAAVAVIVIIVVILMMKKKKNKNTGEPIHKEYDASIANMVNEEPIKGGTFIPSDPVNPNATQMVIPPVVEPQIEMGTPDMITNPNMMQAPVDLMASNPVTMNEPVVPMVPNPMSTMDTTVQLAAEETKLVMPNEVNMGTAMESTAPVTPVAPVTPIMPSLTSEQDAQPVAMPAVAPAPVAEPVAPIMPSLTTEPVAQVIPTVEPAPVMEIAEPVAPLMPDLMAPAVEATSTTEAAPVIMNNVAQPGLQVVVPVDTAMAPPVDLMAPPAEPIVNVGMVAVPLVEQEPIAPEEPAVVEEPKFEMEAPVIEMAPMPEVAEISAAPVMQNTEIAPTETSVIDPMSAVTPDQQKRTPMFVFDLPEEKKTDAPLHQNIEVDVPDMEEMI